MTGAGRAVLAVLLALGATAMAKKTTKSKKDEPQVDPYIREIETWRQKRQDRLLSPEGWLSLAGLYWLEEGDNPFGSSDEHRVVFPDKAPRSIGVLTRRGRQVSVRVNPGMTVTHLGRAITSMDLLSDTTGSPTMLELGSFTFFVIERGERIGVRLRDRDHPAKQTFRGIDAYPIDPEWRINARFEPYTPPRQIQVPTVLGTVEPSTCPGAIVFTRGGQTYRLDAVDEEAGSPELFVIFADKTNGAETYGPGRFLYVPRPKDGLVVIDFNKAYNPPCAFSPYATCPLPPPQNRLPIRVEAGEKKVGDH